MNDDKSFLSKPNYSSVLSESSGSSFRLNQYTDFDPLYDEDEIEEKLIPDPNYKIQKTAKFTLEHKATERPFYSRHHKGSSDDRKNLIPGKNCNKCIKYIQMIEELKVQQRFQAEKCINTEKHLKQYDSLLQIKDNRLTQQEVALKNDLELLDTEKEKFLKERKKFEEDKAKFKNEQDYLSLESERIEKSIQELNKRNEELQAMQNDFETKLEELKIREKNQMILEEEYKDKILISRDDDIQRLLNEAKECKSESDGYLGQHSDNLYDPQNKLQQKKLKLKQKKAELSKFAEELYVLKEKIENDEKNNFQEFENRLSRLSESEEKLLEEKNYIHETEERINEELESIEQLKIILKTQQENLEAERKFIQESYQSKLDELEEMKMAFKKNQIFMNESKERIQEEDSLFSFTENTEISFRKSVNDNTDVIKEYDFKCISLKKELEYIENRLKIVECSREEVETNNAELNQVINELKSKNAALKSKVSTLESNEGILRKEHEEIIMKFSQLESNNKEFESKNEEIESKNKEIELKNKELELKNKEFESKTKEFESKYKEFESKTKEFESKIKSQSEELRTSALKIKDLIAENQRNLKELERYKTLQYQSENYEKIIANPDFFTSKVQKLSEELENKLERIKQKERDLQDLQNYLITEKKNIESGAEFIRSINEDLNQQKLLLCEEREAFEKQKEKIVELDRNQHEKGKLLVNKESELLNFQERLIEREKLISLKEHNAGSPVKERKNNTVIERQHTSPYINY